MQTTFAPASLTCTLLPCQGSGGALDSSFRRLQWRKREDSLEPHMSRETIEYHWGKHHRGYVENLNRRIAGTEMEEMTLEDVVIATYNKGDFLPAFNNAAQAQTLNCCNFFGGDACKM